jgi:hypothetical protein
MNSSPSASILPPRSIKIENRPGPSEYSPKDDLIRPKSPIAHISYTQNKSRVPDNSAKLRGPGTYNPNKDVVKSASRSTLI